MTHNPLASREAAVPELRKPMTPARKRRIHGLAKGICGCDDPECRKPVSLFGKGVIYDHRIPLDLLGPDDWPNLRPVRSECDAKKTPNDLRRIAKARRQSKLTRPKVPSKRPLKSAGKLPKGRKLQGRPFQTGGPKRKIRSRRFA